jgi:hypothetical protein
VSRLGLLCYLTGDMRTERIELNQRDGMTDAVRHL